MYINSFSTAMREKFGTKVYKLSLSGGMTCPNRDGKCGTRGCIFCGDSGSGDFAAPLRSDLDTQIEEAKKRVAFKSAGCAFIAYFQDYTNTYAPAEKLYNLFAPVIEREDISALSIATRPDCLPDEVLEVLSRLNKIKPVWVELGLQTAHEESARYIRRGYELPVFEKAMADLKGIGVETVVHQILGLPGETKEMMWETSSYIGKSGADGIKLHLLYVLRGTDLAEDFLAGKFKTLELDEYIDILEGCIRRLPPEMIIHRITGDGPKSRLIAPLWSGDKKKVLAAINKAFQQRCVIQGSLFDM